MNILFNGESNSVIFSAIFSVIADLLRQMNILFNGESNSVIFSAIFSVIAAYLQKTANRKVAQAYLEELTEVVLMAWDSGHCKEDI